MWLEPILLKGSKTNEPSRTLSTRLPRLIVRLRIQNETPRLGEPFMWRQLRTVGLFRRPRLVFFTVIGRMPDPDEACELIRAIEHGIRERPPSSF